MEVHHSQHKPKNWKEYITEFVMLFAAVTLGFFAENYREHKIIDHRMEENYQALLQDLRQDSARIKELQTDNILERKGMMILLEAIYQYQDNLVNWEQVKNSIASIEKLPSYQTFFMNNTTFKNMQSSGMLSYVSNKDLRKELSFYYEVLFKKLLDNIIAKGLLSNTLHINLLKVICFIDSSIFKNLNFSGLGINLEGVKLDN